MVLSKLDLKKKKVLQCQLIKMSGKEFDLIAKPCLNSKNYCVIIYKKLENKKYLTEFFLFKDAT